MNFPLLHDLAFDFLYVFAGILIFVILERALYLSYLGLKTRGIGRSVRAGDDARPLTLKTSSGGDPITRSVIRYSELAASPGVTRGQLEDFSAALYIDVDKKISARLWVLDTIITGAPLLGLLGTILGIMQTFTALSQGGISDPAEVSRGIGLALAATACGIATALLALLGHNILNRRAQLLTEEFTFLVLRLTPPAVD
jgi:biopolymer transport protein ExbB